MTWTLHPLGARLLVSVRPLPETIGSIVLPDRWAAHITDHDGNKVPVSGGRRESALHADVIRVGPDVRDVSVGDVVLIPALSGQEVGEHRIVAESVVLGFSE